ncbi:hypothetical protein GT044_38915 [Streptomyces sp. SID335]|nr:hypothetical protein [Streptomyces sp. SID335]MYZ16415.1 hypothetical protein [Streptomyces sp. SID337]NDZ90910.1 hypothetical protein [Streptomyces sp. SID10115]NEA00922.1 hypothetical protein [Streptomyces sp. SID10116]NEB46584.1 hypothetical protein [Streptomyces sp. SID339]
MRLTFRVQVLLALLCFGSSLLVAVVAGVLSHEAGAPAAGAVLYGGGAFIGWMTLCVTVLMALGLLRCHSRPGE